MSGESPIELTPRVADFGDALAVRTFECARRTPRYGDTAQKLVRRCGSVLAGNVTAPSGFRCLLFEQSTVTAADRLVGVSAIQSADDGICDWIVMGVLRVLHGSRVADGRSLALTIAEQTARYARDQGYDRMVAQVHRSHQKSLHIVGKLGFTIVRSLDDGYDLYAAELV